MTTIIKHSELLEKLAELEHQQWNHWINYQHSLRKGMVNYVYAQKWKDWLKLAQTPYSKLMEKEKESDREWARKVIELVKLRNVIVPREQVKEFLTFLYSQAPLFCTHGQNELDCMKSNSPCKRRHQKECLVYLRIKKFEALLGKEKTEDVMERARRGAKAIEKFREEGGEIP